MKIGNVDVSDFDFGIGWQSKGNYPDWQSWALSALHNQLPGELTNKTFGMFIATVLGFYFRIHLLGPSGYMKLKGEE